MCLEAKKELIIDHINAESVLFINDSVSNKRIHSEKGKINFIFNRSYGVPKAQIYILLRYKNLFKKIAFLSTYVKLVEEEFYKLYDTFLFNNQIAISLSVTAEGIKIEISGFTLNMTKIAKVFLEFFFFNNITTRKNVVLEQLKDEFCKDLYSASYKRTFQGIKKLVIDEYKLPEEKIIMLEGEMVENAYNISEFVYDIFVVGNMQYENFETLIETLEEYQEEILTVFDEASRNTSKKDLKIKSYDKENNACLVLLCNGNSNDLYKKAVLELYLRIINEMFFDQLRTKEELGYIVSSNTIDIKNKNFIYFLVQSHVDVIFLSKRINEFIDYSRSYAFNMNKELFEKHRNSLIDFYKEKEKNLEDYADFLWKCHLLNIDGLIFKSTMIEHLKKVTLEDVRSMNLFQNSYLITTYASSL